MQNQITIADVKAALKNADFRSKLPSELNEDVQKYLQNPNCTCNFAIYQKILQIAETQIKEYYPNKFYVSPADDMEKLSKNSFTVINCSIGELEERLKKLKPGRKQITVARYEDQVTAIINELDFVY